MDAAPVRVLVAGAGWIIGAIIGDAVGIGVVLDEWVGSWHPLSMYVNGSPSICYNMPFTGLYWWNPASSIVNFPVSSRSR